MLCFLQAYEERRLIDPDFYRDANSLAYGKTVDDPEAAIDRMVGELNDQCALETCTLRDEVLDSVIGSNRILQVPFSHPQFKQKQLRDLNCRCSALEINFGVQDLHVTQITTYQHGSRRLVLSTICYMIRFTHNPPPRAPSQEDEACGVQPAEAAPGRQGRGLHQQP